ncbi:hypothetical protein H5410_051527, partial [Solanum commersonii]
MVEIRWSMPVTSVDLLNCWNQNDGAERNYRTFEDKYKFVEKINMNCLFLLYFWCKESYAEAESLYLSTRLTDGTEERANQ